MNLEWLNLFALSKGSINVPGALCTQYQHTQAFIVN